MNDITTVKQQKLENVITRIQKFDKFERQFAEAIWITSGYGSGFIENYADSYSVLQELNNFGIKSFPSKKAMDKRIAYLIDEIVRAEEDPRDYFIEDKRVLPTLGKILKFKEQKVFKITKIGLVALFVSMNEYRWKMFKVSNLLDQIVMLLPSMGHQKFIEDLMQDNLTIDAFMTTGDVLLEHLPVLSMTEHYEQWAELLAIGQGTDPDQWS